MEVLIMLPNTEFLLTSLIVVLIPGTGVIYTVSTGLLQGGRQSMLAALGCTLGILPHLLACVLGLTVVMHMSAIAFTLMKYAGMLYLFYLAWSMWRETGMFNLESGNGNRKGLAIVSRGLLINLLNPKLSIFFLAFLPQFIAVGSEHALGQMLLLSAIFMLMTLLVFIAYGLCANAFRLHLKASPHWIKRIQRGCAALFAALGAKLAMAEQ